MPCHGLYRNLLVIILQVTTIAYEDSVICNMAVSVKLIILIQLIYISFSRADFHNNILNFNNYQELKQYCILWYEKVMKTFGTT